jgi:lipopolysaccharide transport system ATP-binding protein
MSMTDDIAIRARGLGKLYNLGETVDLTRNFRETLMSLPRIFGSAVASRAPKEDGKDILWALRDLDFEIKRGEAVGIIGRNGAGKSTLLKVLSRITWPTTGEVEVHGRVGSLLEVGTGFHQELTGRENIFLNGAILGMRKSEIDRKFDEIVEFSGVEKFLETPVKRYSSGMRVRLAFAVAAHLDPEILIVDEVLSVGDADFRKKCLGKMNDFTQGGRTVFFVSHNMPAVRQLCTSCIWLEKGKVLDQGNPENIIAKYLQTAYASSSTAEVNLAEDRTKQFQVRSVRILDVHGNVAAKLSCDSPITVELGCQVNERVPGLYGYLSLRHADGYDILISDSFDSPPNPLDDLEIGYHKISITIPPRILGVGEYGVYLNFASRSGAVGFHVDSPGVVVGFHLDDQTSPRGNRRGGLLSTMPTWKRHGRVSNQTIVE